MKTFGELGTLPKVGDLIIRLFANDESELAIITNIIGDTYHHTKTGHGRYMHVSHLRGYYHPLRQEKK